MEKGFVYILSNKKKSVLYIGTTKDLGKRVSLYKNGKAVNFTRIYKVNE